MQLQVFVICGLLKFGVILLKVANLHTAWIKTMTVLSLFLWCVHFEWYCPYTFWCVMCYSCLQM